ncbi:MAG: hypothetical protein MZV49_20995 [Rhodopseudomonas palustris]|nr:hypothetical protein [Rhodopseudomonas palustris]
MRRASPGMLGSKRFTESYILGEIIRHTAQSAGEAGAAAPARPGQYRNRARAPSGPAASTSIPSTRARSPGKYSNWTMCRRCPNSNARLAPLGIAVSVPLGFENTYALAMRTDDARARGIASAVATPDAQGPAAGAVPGVPRPVRRLARVEARLRPAVRLAARA